MADVNKPTNRSVTGKSDLLQLADSIRTTAKIAAAGPTAIVKTVKQSLLEMAAKGSPSTSTALVKSNANLADVMSRSSIPSDIARDSTLHNAEMAIANTGLTLHRIYDAFKEQSKPLEITASEIGEQTGYLRQVSSDMSSLNAKQDIEIDATTQVASEIGSLLQIEQQSSGFLEKIADLAGKSYEIQQDSMQLQTEFNERDSKNRAFEGKDKSPIGMFGGLLASVAAGFAAVNRGLIDASRNLDDFVNNVSHDSLDLRNAGGIIASIAAVMYIFKSVSKLFGVSNLKSIGGILSKSTLAIGILIGAFTYLAAQPERLGALMDAMGKAFGGLKDLMGPLLKFLGQLALMSTGVFTALGGILVEVLIPVLNVLGTVLSDAGDAITVINDALSLVIGWLVEFGTNLEGNNLSEKGASAIKAVGDWYLQLEADVLGYLDELIVQPIRDGVNVITTSVSEFWTGMQADFALFMETINPMEHIKNLVEMIPADVQQWIEDAATRVKDSLVGTIDSNPLVQAARGFINYILGWIPTEGDLRVMFRQLINNLPIADEIKSMLRNSVGLDQKSDIGPGANYSQLQSDFTRTTEVSAGPVWGDVLSMEYQSKQDELTAAIEQMVALQRSAISDQSNPLLGGLSYLAGAAGWMTTIEQQREIVVQQQQEIEELKKQIYKETIEQSKRNGLSTVNPSVVVINPQSNQSTVVSSGNQSQMKYGATASAIQSIMDPMLFGLQTLLPK